MKSNNGNVFGGFAGAPWNSNNDYIESDDSFLFQLTTFPPTKHPIY